MSSNKKLNYSEVYELISRKILINKMTSEQLRKQIEFSAESKKLQDFAIDDNKYKLQLVDDLTKLFEQQLSNFDENRQEECLEIYKQLNENNKPSYEYVEQYKKLMRLERDIKSLAERVDALEKTIPSNVEFEHYAVSAKNPAASGACTTDQPTWPADELV